MTTLTNITQTLSSKLKKLKWETPAYVYNPLEYALKPHLNYLLTYGNHQKEVLFLGMNPGPWGMAQNGVPFGEINIVKNWLKISGTIEKPHPECPKKPVLGWDCKRSEISGLRLWGYIQAQYKTPGAFFKKFMVLNYCPLLFLAKEGQNLTPDKLTLTERSGLQVPCDEALKAFVDFYKPKLVVGVGAYAQKCLERVVAGSSIRVGTLLHPSPASPMANKNWAKIAHEQLTQLL